MSGDQVAASPNELERALLAKDEEIRALRERSMELAARVEQLEKEINTPEIHDFARAVVLESAHQRLRWGTEHDAGKKPEDWFWLIGALAGKACRYFHMAEVLEEIANADGFVYGKDQLLKKAKWAREKALHHICTTAAACGNWHLNAMQVDTRMRPGIEPPKEVELSGAE